MRHLLLIPVVLSSLTLGAHLLRGGHAALAFAAAALPFLLACRHPAALRTLQLALVAGAAAWTVTLVRLVDLRRAGGMPWHRLAVILGAVALVTLASALAAQSWWAARSARRGVAKGAGGGSTAAEGAAS